MKSSDIKIEVSPAEAISAVITISERCEPQTAVVVAHGAGNDMNNPLLISFCAGLAEAGYLTARFNFPYKEHGRKAPDGRESLELTWRRALHYIRNKAGYSLRKIFLAGKSMGGRVASEMLAAKTLTADGIIFLGYLLHPAHDKEKLRDRHLPMIKIPMLFFAGTRDSLCDLALLQVVLRRLGPQVDLEVIEGADHSFNLSKSSLPDGGRVYDRIARRSIQWIGGHLKDND